MGNFAENLNLGNRSRPPPPDHVPTKLCRPLFDHESPTFLDVFCTRSCSMRILILIHRKSCRQKLYFKVENKKVNKISIAD